MGRRKTPKIPVQHSYAKWCVTCGKQSYISRRDARASRNRDARHEPGIRAYICPADGQYWHLGHMPPSVRGGTITSYEIYGPGGTIDARREHPGDAPPTPAGP